jgi:hypothetical protein
LAAIQRQGDFSTQLAQGRNPFSGEGETEYNQNMAKRAAIVASVFGGAALAGGAGAGSSAAPVAGESAAVAAPAAYGVGAGNTAGLGVLGGESAAAGGAYGFGATGLSGGGTGAGAAGATTASAAPAYAGTTMGAEAMALPLGSQAVSMAPATETSASGSWAPYAQAGGTIMSTLFSGLMQMEQQKEQLKREKQMALAKSHLEKAQAENAALDRLIQVWQGARR